MPGATIQGGLSVASVKGGIAFDNGYQLVVATSDTTPQLAVVDPAGNIVLTFDPSASISVAAGVQWKVLATGKLAVYAGQATVSPGQPYVVANTVNKAETASADPSVLAFTPPASAQKYLLLLSVDVAAGATNLIVSLTVNYTDSNGQATGDTAVPMTQLGGALNVSFTTSARHNYQGEYLLATDNSGTQITVKWVGGGTLGTSNVIVNAILIAMS